MELSYAFFYRKRRLLKTSISAFWTCHLFSQGNASLDFDEAVWICSMHALKRYRLIRTVLPYDYFENEMAAAQRFFAVLDVRFSQGNGWSVVVGLLFV